MNSAPHLLNEDREEFARILDQALRTAAYRPDDLGTGAGKHLSTEQLRTMALSATTAIAACATAEYHRYVRLRTALRTPASTSYCTGASGEEQDEASGESAGPATAGAGEATESAGAGLAAMITVLAPVLAGIAAVLFLLIGYILRTISPDRAVAQPLISVGWIFAALTAAGSLVAMTCLVITALRNGSRSTRAAELAAELDRAHEDWRHALLERGLLPFLREALADPDPASAPDHDPARYVPRRTAAPENRIPTLGYTRPKFTSPDTGPAASRPRYSSPDFTSPDYGGPEHGGAGRGGPGHGAD